MALPPMGEPAIAPVWLGERLRLPVYNWPAHRADGWPGHRSSGHGHRGSPYSLACLLRRIETAPEGSRNTTVYGAFIDAAKQGDLDAFADTLAAAAVDRGLPPDEVAGIIRSVRLRGR
jgi:hypothetical protein